MFTLALICGAYSIDCNVQTEQKIDCGHVGTQKPDCLAKGCCWQPESAFSFGSKNENIPWCYYPASYPNPCKTFNWVASDPGFTQSFVDLMITKFEANLNIQDSGAVVASQDKNTPGGSYYYHWMRDAGLSIKTYMDINDNNYSKVKDVLSAYTQWVSKVQKKHDPNNIDVRTEPKFTIPDGNPYTGGWCRPQTDGTGLRSHALIQWGKILVGEGQTDQVKNVLWPLIQFDLQWVTDNWQSNGCDLWEEVHSTDFFWNRSAFVFSLNTAAELAGMIGEKGQAYLDLAGTIATATKGHFNGNYIYESTNRELDGSVTHSIATFGKYIYPVTSSETAKTISVYNEKFCMLFPINVSDNKAGIPGVLYGRYPGDSYAGGNPWQLLSAALAECFYLGAVEFEDKIISSGDFELTSEHSDWLKLLNLSAGAKASEFVAASKSAGDSVMQRIWAHVKNDGGRIDEQISKTTGLQTSAKGLTWSYANILHALHVRSKLA